jgi:DNA-binding LacI/PurR family transcriptional regulator/signal transduction histidine kinase/ActR/RegA family two-component response regulator
MDVFGDGYESDLRSAFDARARELDLDLLFVYGRNLSGPERQYPGHNYIYRLIRPECVDGLLITAGLASYSGPGAIGGLCRAYAPLPLCTMGIAVPGVPSVMVDQRPGMEAIVEHVIVHHQRRRIAFIAGPRENPDAKIRQAAYRDTLERFGLPFDATLVAEGRFIHGFGRAAMERILDSGTSVDAVVAANDGMALGAMEALRQRGLRIPADAVVTGYDDMLLARLANPPLTTVAQPFAAVADATLNLLLDQLEGHEVSLSTQVPTNVVIRQSCGCTSRIHRVIPSAHAVALPLSDFLRQAGPRIELMLGKTLGSPGLAARFVKTCEETTGTSDALMAVLMDALATRVADTEWHQQLRNALTQLREELRPVSARELDYFWNDAFGLLIMADARSHALRRVTIAQTCIAIMIVGEQLSSSQDLAAFSTALGDGLVRMGITDALVSRRVEEPPGQLAPIVCLVSGQARSERAAFPEHLLIPPLFRQRDQRATWLVFPIAFETECLGLALFGYRADAEGYVMLMERITAALRGVGLLQEVVRKTTLHERSVQERLATARRMEALRVLAGGVAHDLNNALGPLVALPDVLLQELDEANDACPKTELRDDLECIKHASVRAAQTIKDLLTLSRQGRVLKGVVDLNQAVAQCVTAEPWSRVKEAGCDIQVSFEPYSQPMLVQASESHLVRAITNLVRNAVESIQQGGRVVVQTKPCAMAEPASGYEIVPPGDYVTVVVTDTGQGICADDLGRIFEPFFSRKRLGEHSGSGLGLAIVHGVVKEHDGFVDVRSVVGQGTAFTLYFPSAAAPLAVSDPTSLLPSRRRKILVVDDDPIQLRTARRVLAHLGHEADTRTSGTLAYELFVRAAATHGSGSRLKSREGPYDLVIFDMLLGEEQDGLEVVSRIRELFPAQPAIIVSGHAPSERAENAIRKGLTWLAKPYSTDVFARAVETGLANRAF